MTTGRSGYTILNGGDLVIQRIDWGRYATLTAWVPSSTMGEHLTITFIDGLCYGRMGTERLPAKIAALPPHTEERTSAVRAWREQIYGRAYAAIEAAVPEAAASDRRDMGEITIETTHGLAATTPTP